MTELLKRLEEGLKALLTRRKSLKFASGMGCDGKVVVEVFKASTVKFDAKGDIVEGEMVSRSTSPNMIVDTGLNQIRGGIGSGGSLQQTYMAAGSGSTAADHAQTVLVAELGRVAMLDYINSASVGVVTIRAVFNTTDANGNMREFGCFNDPAAGTMFCRTVLGASFVKDTSLIVRVSWVFTVTDA